MWSFELGLDPQAVLLAQLVIEALLVVMVGTLWWRQRRPHEAAGSEGAMAATENLLRRLEEKRRALEGAVESVRAKDDLVAPHRPGPALREEKAIRRHPLERAAALAAKGMSSAAIARQLGVPRGEVETYLSLHGAEGRQA